MALAGPRALWTHEWYTGNAQCGVAVFTGARGKRGRRVGVLAGGTENFVCSAGHELAGDGNALLYVSDSDVDDRADRVFRVAKTAQVIRGTEGTDAVAVSRGVFVVRSTSDGRSVEGRHFQTGDLLRTFTLPDEDCCGCGACARVAFDGTRVARLTYRTTGGPSSFEADRDLHHRRESCSSHRAFKSRFVAVRHLGKVARLQARTNDSDSRCGDCRTLGRCAREVE